MANQPPTGRVGVAPSPEPCPECQGMGYFFDGDTHEEWDCPRCSPVGNGERRAFVNAVTATLSEAAQPDAAATVPDELEQAGATLTAYALRWMQRERERRG